MHFHETYTAQKPSKASQKKGSNRCIVLMSFNIKFFGKILANQIQNYINS